MRSKIGQNNKADRLYYYSNRSFNNYSLNTNMLCLKKLMYFKADAFLNGLDFFVGNCIYFENPNYLNSI